jgi:hypothetical protein
MHFEDSYSTQVFLERRSCTYQVTRSDEQKDFNAKCTFILPSVLKLINAVSKVTQETYRKFKLIKSLLSEHPAKARAEKPTLNTCGPTLIAIQPQS